MARAGHPDEQGEFPAVRLRVHFKALKRRAGGPTVIGSSLVGFQSPNKSTGGLKMNGVFPAIAAAREAKLQVVAGGEDGVVHSRETLMQQKNNERGKTRETASEGRRRAFSE
jgi:hypothetical protein